MLDFASDEPIEFELSDKQKLLRSSAITPARHILAYGGSRSGKTFAFIYFTVIRAISSPGSRHLVARLHNIDVRQSVMMDTFLKVMRLAFPGLAYELNKSDQFARFPNGAEIWFLGLDDAERVEKILGKEFATIYFNECSQLPYATITTVRTRLAQNCTKINGARLPLKFYYDLNPVGKRHWSYVEFIEGLRPEDRTPLAPGRSTFVQLNPLDNPHLPPEYLEELEALPELQRKRFKDGEYQSDVPGALWPAERIAQRRVSTFPSLTRIAIGVDPSGSDGMGGDSQGIIAAGMGVDDNAYVFEDATVNLSPAGWGAVVADLYRETEADIVVAEKNYGGAMVESTIQGGADDGEEINVKLITASRGKHVRAEPIAALYEDRPGRPARVFHVGEFPELEDQLSLFTTAGYTGAGSPDRADALVWALTELFFGEETDAGIFLKRKHR